MPMISVPGAVARGSRRRVLPAFTIALVLSAGVAHAEDSPATLDEQWVGALSTDRFTDATWRIAAGRGTGDRGNIYELRISCRRDGARRDLETEIVLFGGDRAPLSPDWDIDRRTGASLRALRWRLDRQPAATTRAVPAESDNAARIDAWSWRGIETGLRREERARRENTDRLAFLTGLRRGTRLLIGDLVEGEAVEFALPRASAGGPCPLCVVIDECLGGADGP